MPLTHAEIVTRLEAKLWVATNTQWTSAIIIADGMTPILKIISRRVPFVTTQRHPGDRAVPIRGGYTTDGTTRDIILTDWDFEDMVKLAQENGVEYEVDQSPKEFRNFTQNGKIVTLELDDIPEAAESVYIYPERLHILQQAIGTTDTAGAITTLAAIGATSLVLKSLGTGTINKYTKLTIAGDTTEYMVTSIATIAGNAATVTITPGLVASAAVDAVVTLALADSTLTPALEEIFIEWVAGELIQDYAIKKLSEADFGSGINVYFTMGKDMIDGKGGAREQLRGLERADRYPNHSRV